MTLDLTDFLDGHRAELIRTRRHIHAHPELGRTEHETTALLVQRLEMAGLRPRVLSGGTGLICDIEGPYPSPVVALRADIDALPIQDEKDVSYRSTRPGLCHACGHDVHTTVLLGTALALAERADQLRGTVRLIFQPAEELVSGALDVVAEGAVDDAAAIFALHCDPKLDTGRVATRVGSITGAADMVEVLLTGPGGHTARPHLTTDLAYAISRVVTDLPAGLSRLADPRAAVSLVFGMVSAGTVHNVIPSTAVARGTLRALDREAWEAAPKFIQRLLDGVTGPLEVMSELRYERGTPPVVNDAGATALAVRAASSVLGDQAVGEALQSLGGEDFAWYLEQVPGCFLRLGTRVRGTELDLHAGAFDVDERAIDVGVRVMTQVALDALRHYG